MDRVAESNAIFLDAWGVLGQGSPGLESRRGGLIEVAWCGLPNLFFNLALTTKAPASIENFADAVNETAAWAAERHNPWMLAVCHETVGALLPEVQPLLEQLGFVPMMPLTGMEADRANEPGRARPAGTWRSEADKDIGGQVIRLNEAAYHMSMGEPGSLPMECPGWWVAPERMASVLAVEGRPVSCAAVLNLEGLRYVAFVATLPEAQGKGYGEAAMRDVLERSLTAGLRERTYLHATAAGLPVYERMGYKVTAEYTVYMKI